MDIKILVTVHKKCWLPKASCYLTLQVGAEGKENIGFIRDDSGSNISNKNANYCELTGLYWAWKNLTDIDYLGLCHYRRFFAHEIYSKSLDKKQRAIYTDVDYKDLLTKFTCLVPQKRHYFIETVRSQYEHAHHKQDLDLTEQIVRELFPDYAVAFEDVMDQRCLHLYNMFVMKKELVDAYCQFLFGVLFELEKRLDISCYNQYDARVFGFLGERLFNVWLLKNHIEYKEVPVVFLGEINWLIKGSKFLKRKFWPK